MGGYHYGDDVPELHREAPARTVNAETITEVARHAVL
jgi:hypothetical protein